MRIWSLLGVALAVAFVGLAAGAPAQTAVPAITLQRNVVPALYTPGQLITVTLTINKNDTRDVTAVAVQETVPETWTYENVSSTNPGMTPIKGQETGNDNGTKTLPFYYIAPPAFPITFTYRMTAGTVDSGSLSIFGRAIYRFAGAEEQSPVVTTPVVAIVQTEGESGTEGEPADRTACSGCNQPGKNMGTMLGDLFAGGLAFLSLLALSRRHG